jgi:hypothetical protein
MQKSGLAGRVSLWLANGGAYSGILLEIGSSLVVDRHHIATFCSNVARKGGFFFGGTKCRPYVLGGECSWGSRWLRLFGF